METKKDSSYGVIPLIHVNGEWRVLVIHQNSYRGDVGNFWIFPKGHADEGETNQETALRELEEETGVSSVSLETEKTFSMTYSFRHEEKLIEKTVKYFIGYCDTEETKITQPIEVRELKWASVSEAEALLTHQNSRDLLKDVVSFLASKNT